MPDALVVELTRKINAPPARVWEIVSSEAGLRDWLGPKTYEPREGGRILFDVLHNDQRWVMFGNVTAWKPGAQLAFTWQELDVNRLTCWPAPTLVSIDLAADGDGTMVSLSHRGFDKLPDAEEQFRSYKQGWESLNDLETLATMCEDGS
jgi:uncharacterized protein YndB with AHSA1/START domain